MVRMRTLVVFISFQKVLHQENVGWDWKLCHLPFQLLNYFNLQLCHCLLLRSLRAMTRLHSAWSPETGSAWIKWEYIRERKTVVTFIEQCGESLAGSLVLPYVSVTLPGWLPGFLSMVRQIRTPEEHSEHPSGTTISSAAICYCSWKSTWHDWLFVWGRDWERTFNYSTCSGKMSTRFKMTAKP